MAMPLTPSLMVTLESVFPVIGFRRRRLLTPVGPGGGGKPPPGLVVENRTPSESNTSPEILLTLAGCPTIVTAADVWLTIERAPSLVESPLLCPPSPPSKTLELSARW